MEKNILVYNNRTGIAEKMAPLMIGEGFSVLVAADLDHLYTILEKSQIHLMLVDVLQWKCFRHTLLSIKTDRKPLNSADIIDGASLVEIGKGNVPMLLIHLHRSNGRRYLLDEGKPLLQIPLVGPVDHIL